MFKIIFLIVLIFTLPSTAYWNSFTSIDLWNISIKYNTYKLSGTWYTLKVAISEEAQELRDIARENNAISAINWVFFCPADYNKSNGQNYTINERFQNGEDLSFYQDTGERGVFAWDRDGLPFLFKTWYINPERRSEIYEWMWNFPILLSAWISNISYYDAIWLLDTKMKVTVPRHFICSNQEWSEIYFWRSSSVSLDTLTQHLPKIGCYNALNLDAGLSSHYIHNGKDIVDGKRNVIDAFIIQHNEINIQDLEDIADSIIKKHFQKYKYRVDISSIMITQKYIDLLKSVSNSIEERHTTSIYDDAGSSIWYITNVLDTKDVKTLYIVETLVRKIKGIQNSVKLQLQNL